MTKAKFQMLIDRLRAITPVDPVSKAIQEEAKRKGLDKMTMKEINAEVAAARRERRAKAATAQAK